MIGQWLLFLGMLAVAGLWLGAMRSRERALAAARRICSAHAVQLLDETVGLGGLRLRRHHGLLQLVLRYDFEVSLNGLDRQSGHLWIASGRVINTVTNWLPPDVLGSTVAEEKVVDLLQRLRKQD